MRIGFRRIGRRFWLGMSAAASVCALLVPTASALAAGTLTVTDGGGTIFHDSVCTLPEAILEANLTAGPGVYTECGAANFGGADTIVLNKDVMLMWPYPSGTIISGGIAGTPDITSQITIQANGTNDTIARPVSGAPFRLFYVAAGGNLTLSGLTLQDGSIIADVGSTAQGGSILSQGALTLTNVRILTASAEGGAGSDGADGASPGAGGTGGTAYGGAIYASGTSLTITNSQISDAAAIAGDGGIGGSGVGGGTVGGAGGTGGAAYGGAIYSTATTVSITNTTISGGTASGGLGGAGNTSDQNGGNGGTGGAASGGGVYTGGGSVQIAGTTINGGASTGGAGGPGGDPAPSFSAGAAGGSAAGKGGGIYHSAGTLSLANTTLDDNTASGSGAQGGGVYAGAAFSANSATIAGNQAATGGGVALQTGALTLANSIIAAQISGADCALVGGSLTSSGHNIDSDGSCGLAGTGDHASVTRSQLNLGALEDNGGPTPSRMPHPPSAAIDAGSTALTTDQTGRARPVGGAADIGAVETFFAATNPPALTNPVDGSTTNQIAFTAVWSKVTNATKYLVELSDHPDFSANVQTVAVPATATKLLEAYGYAHVYWRVKALVGGDWTDYSHPRNLFLSWATAPKNNTLFVTHTPKFTWKSAGTGVTYSVGIDTNPANLPATPGTTLNSTGTTVTSTALPYGVYFYQILANPAVIAPTPITSFTVTILKTPTNHLASSVLTPKLTWAAEKPTPTAYHVMVSANSAVTTGDAFNYSGTATSATISPALAYGRYFWKAETTNAPGVFTPIFTFDVTIMTSPKYGTVTTDTTPTFAWKKIVSATSYSVSISPNADCSAASTQVTGNVATFTWPTPLARGFYYWCVTPSPGTQMPAWPITIGP